MAQAAVKQDQFRSFVPLTLNDESFEPDDVADALAQESDQFIKVLPSSDNGNEDSCLKRD